MTVRDAAWLSLGALVSPLAQVLVARFAGRHWLDIKEKS